MKYLELLDTLNTYQLALTTMSFDAQTIAPKAGSAYRNKAMTILSGEYFKIMTSEETYQTLSEASKSDDVIVSKGAHAVLKELNKVRDIPVEEYIAFQEVLNGAHEIWEQARTDKDYSQFEETLDKILDIHHKLIAYQKTSLSDYDASLDEYEEGLRMEAVDQFFKTLETDLVPHLDTIINAQGLRPAFMRQFVSIDDQRKISELLMNHLGYSKDFGVLGEAAHPFSSTLSINDSRITTHYHEDDFTQSIFSIIHEIGHSMYNHQVNPDFEGTPLADNMSMSIHESQSRFLENMIGRSKEFWTPIYKDLQAIIPDVLGNVSLDEYILGINYVERGYIRIEADEVTYPLHIMVRYNLEKMMVEDKHPAKGLDKVFSDEMTRLLGVTPEDASQGILQDVHWSGGSFGYFPTYALGTAYAAQFMNELRKTVDVEALLLEGDLPKLFDWLRENIHQYSGTITTQDLIKQVTNESFNPNYYVSYIKEKYGKLLGINFD